MACMAGGTHLPQVTVAMRRFHIMGGECNYLLRVTPDASKRLEFVPEEQWKGAAMMSWSEEAIQSMLTSAEAVLRTPPTASGSPSRCGPCTVAPVQKTAPADWRKKHVHTMSKTVLTASMKAQAPARSALFFTNSKLTNIVV